MNVSGLPSLNVGQHSLLFLNHDKLLGLGQGVFHIENSAAIRPKKPDCPPRKCSYPRSQMNKKHPLVSPL